jgi:hypothetical protein
VPVFKENSTQPQAWWSSTMQINLKRKDAVSDANRKTWGVKRNINKIPETL